eukprot:scaffold54684_cov18-Tisochrysis_lutea.AAC.1
MGGPCKQLAERGQGDLQVRVLMQRCVLGSAAGCCRLRVSNGPLVEGFKMLAALLVSNRWHLPNDNVSNPLSGATIPMLRAGQLNPQLPRANAFESVLAKCEESGGLAYSLKAWSYGSWMIQAPTLLDEFRTLVVKKAIASLAASFARARQRNRGFGSAVAAAATAAGLHRFNTVQLANLLWALTSMRVQDRALLVRGQLGGYVGMKQWVSALPMFGVWHCCERTALSVGGLLLMVISNLLREGNL